MAQISSGVRFILPGLWTLAWLTEPQVWCLADHKVLLEGHKNPTCYLDLKSRRLCYDLCWQAI